jgi:hypothetical protein
VIDLQSAYLRAYLDGVTRRIEHAATTLDWAHGHQHLIPEHLIPPFPADPTARASAVQDWERYKRHVQSLGPRILKTKRMGAVGHVNWGGDSEAMDERLEALDLRALARSSFDPLACNGVTSAWAYRDERTGVNRVQALGGYLEPIYYEDDPAGDVIGLLQITQDPGALKVRYRARVYDFEERSVREWRDLSDPTRLDGPPTTVWENTSVPRVALYDVNHDGYPVGELATALNTLRAEVALQLRIARVADAQAYGILALAGDWELGQELGPTTVLRAGDPSSGASRVQPAALDELFTLHDRTMERIRSDLGLPISSITSGAWPSGEALQQANLAYVTSSSDYAHLLTRLLTDVVSDFAALEGITDPPPVSVGINREQMRATISAQVREDFARGIVSLRAAAVAISPYYPEWSSDEIEDFINDTPDPERHDAGETPEAVESVREQAEALGVLIRAGVEPVNAARLVGLPDAKFTGAVPVTLRVPEAKAETLED